jgi:hypothetical protein
MRLIDNTIALRIIYLLVKPIQDTDAFKLGLINAQGETIRKAKTSQEKKSTSMLHRLCWRIKRVFALVPGGKTRIGSLAAAYLLVRESVNKNLSEDQATQLFTESVNKDIQEFGESDLVNTICQIADEGRLNEDGGASVTTASLGGMIELPLFREPLKRKPKRGA